MFFEYGGKLASDLFFQIIFVGGALLFVDKPTLSNLLGLRPPGLEFRNLCLEDSVISIISPSSGGSPGPV